MVNIYYPFKMFEPILKICTKVTSEIAPKMKELTEKALIFFGAAL